MFSISLLLNKISTSDMIFIITLFLLLGPIIVRSYYFKKLSRSHELGLFTRGFLGPTRLPLKEPITRESFIQQIPRGKNISILEIGPYHSPALTGDNVRYFDVLNQNELLQRSRAENLPKTNIPKIHYVSPTGDMEIIKEKFDVIFSSHNIEHQVDLIQHLQIAARLLKENGKYYLAIPDKRFCFDHFIPETALSEVIATHEEPRKTHDLRTVIAMRCETTHNDPACHFQRGRGYMGGKGYMGDYLMSKDIRKLKSNLTCYTKAVKEYQQANGQYIDVHKWRFTPDSFYIIMESLYALGYSSFEIDIVYRNYPETNEFYAILRKS